MHSIRGAVAAALAVLCVAAPAALAHEGNPNYRSEVRAITPALPGLEARVLGYDDAIELVYDGERPLVVEGYRGEPYLRFNPDGLVEVNRRSPAAYLNEDRFAKVELHGETITRGVSEVTYTAKQPLPPVRLDSFAISLKLPAGEEGESVYFPTIQTCEKGETRWIQIPAEGEKPRRAGGPGAGCGADGGGGRPWRCGFFRG